MNEHWICPYCGRVHPTDRFECFGCGAALIETNDCFNNLAPEKVFDPISPYFLNEGLRVRDPERYAVWMDIP